MFYLCSTLDNWLYVCILNLLICWTYISIYIVIVLFHSSIYNKLLFFIFDVVYYIKEVYTFISIWCWKVFSKKRKSKLVSLVIGAWNTKRKLEGLKTCALSSLIQKVARNACYLKRFSITNKSSFFQKIFFYFHYKH